MKLGKTLNKVMQSATIGGDGTITKKPLGGAKTFSAPEITHANQKVNAAKSDEENKINKLVGTKDPTGRNYTVETAKQKIDYDKYQNRTKKIQ